MAWGVVLLYPLLKPVQPPVERRQEVLRILPSTPSCKDLVKTGTSQTAISVPDVSAQLIEWLRLRQAPTRHCPVFGLLITVKGL
jgi:hypothetical protein